MNNKNRRNKVTDPTFTTDDPSIELVDAGEIDAGEIDVIEVEVVDAGEVEAPVVAPVVILEPAPVVVLTVHRVTPTIF